MMPIDSALLKIPKGLVRAAIPFLAVAAATLLGIVVSESVGHAVAFVFFLPAVLFSAQLGGLGPGFLAIAISVLSARYFFIHPRFEHLISNPDDLRSVIAFGAIALIFCVFGASSRKWHANVISATNGFRAIFTKAGVGIVELDREGRFIAVNDRFCEILGRPAATLLGKTVYDLTAPEDLLLGEKLKRKAASGEAKRFEIEQRCLRSDGTRVWVHITVSGIGNPDEPGFRIIGTVEDISQRKRAEEAKDSLARIVESSDDAIISISIDRQARILTWNDGARRMFGYEKHEIIGQSVHVLIPEERSQEVGNTLSRVSSGKAVEHEETMWIGKGGGQIPVWVTASPVRDEAGDVVAVSEIVRDITELRRYEAALQRRSEGLKILSETAASLLAPRDEKRVVEELFSRVGPFLNTDIFLNYEVAEEGSALRLEASAGIDSDSLTLFSKLHFGETACGIYSGSHKPVCFSHVQNVDWKGCPAKSLGAKAFACFPLMAGERLVGTLGFGSRTKDRFSEEEIAFMGTLSHYVAIAKERVRTERALQKAGAAKDQFLAVLSHELRTPLTPVLAAVSLMERKGLTPEVQYGLDIIRRNIGLEARLIDDLLDLTRIVRGKVTLSRTPLDIREVIERAVQVCKTDIEARNLHLRLDLNRGPCVVNGDPSRLQQVFWNLIKNAIKFTPEHGIVGIRTLVKEGKVVTEVKDTGIGIEASLLPRIFNAFEQGGEGVTRQFGGLGLGLAIVKRVVEMHGGTISAESEGKGRGALFSVELPLFALSETVRGGAERPAAAASHPPKHILLVEDHGDTAQMMRAVLESSGHEVETAGDVRQALHAANERTFDILLSDLGLPDGSGIDLVRELRKEGSSLKAIALSGFGREDDVRQCKDAGFAEHLTKPVDVDALLAAVDRVSS